MSTTTSTVETGNFRSISEHQFDEKLKKRFNLSAISKTDIANPSAFVVPAKPASNFDIRHLVIPCDHGDVRGSGFVAQPDCSFLATRDMFAVSITVNVVAKWDQNKVVLLGIGFGSKTAIPTLPGILIGDNYVSRFRQAKAGRGVGREDTFSLSVELAGKGTTDPDAIGIKEGDFVFPVIWTPEGQAVNIQIDDMIISVSETFV